MNDFISVIMIIGILSSMISIVIGVWSIYQKRDKMYAKKIKEFNIQKERIKKELEKERKKHEKY